MTAPALDLRAMREATVYAHIEAECRHDIGATLRSFHRPKYDVVPFGRTTEGADAVRDLLESLMTAFPDFHAELLTLRHAEDAVVCEVMMTGTQQGPWMGLAASGRSIHVPAACIFEFEQDRLMCEKVYFDSATMMGQLIGD